MRGGPDSSSLSDQPRHIAHACSLILDAIDNIPSTWPDEQSRQVADDLHALQQCVLLGELGEAERRIETLIAASPSEWRQRINVIDAEIRPLLDAFWKNAPAETESARARLVRQLVRRGNCKGATDVLSRTSDFAVTIDDHLALVDLAIDEGDFDTVEHIYGTRLRKPVPREVALRCAEMMWRRFRDLLPTSDSPDSALAHEALNLFVEFNAPERAQRLAFQFLDTLAAVKDYRLWASHLTIVFFAFEDSGTPLPREDLESMCDWAIDRIADLEASPRNDSSEEILSLRGLVREIERRTFAADINAIRKP